MCICVYRLGHKVVTLVMLTVLQSDNDRGNYGGGGDRNNGGGDGDGDNDDEYDNGGSG